MKNKKLLLFAAILLFLLSIYLTAEYIQGNERIDTELIAALLNKDIQTAKEIYANNQIDLNCLKNEGSPLLFSVLPPDGEPDKTWSTIEFMLLNGCSINSRDKKNSTLLMCSIENQLPPEIVEKIINAGADVRLKNDYGCTALHYAAYAAEDYTVKYTGMLLKHKADVNAEDSSGESPLEYAASMGQIEMMRFLLASGANVNNTASKGKTALYAAAEYGSYEAVKILLSKGASVDGNAPDDETPLTIAVDKGHKKIAELLIEKGADLHKGKNIYILNRAAYLDDYDFSKYLISKGAHVNGNRSCESSLSQATASGNLKMVKLLLKNNANPNIGGGTPPLMYSVLYSNHEISELLLKHGADPDVKDSKGISPRSVVTERIADPVFANEKSSYEKILKMMNEKK